MTDYGTLLRDHGFVAVPYLSSGVRTQTSGCRGRMHVSSLATEVCPSFFSRVWQNRGCAGEVGLSVCRVAAIACSSSSMVCAGQTIGSSSGDAPAYAGADLIIARDGRIAAVHLFFDKL